MKNKLNNYIYHKYANLCTKKYLYAEKIKMNRKGISQLVEVAGVLAIIVACIILVVPQAKDAVSGIWRTVTTNAKSFFNSSTR
ncbi:hypothetical protein NPD5_3980 [Clostridium sporogenes]|uniref:Uncharacterized protein n=1 Tax=Clostridium sporogenes TaxID=1509 RepID=A0A1L3NH83_CLOSG|nr:hypothetical protein [Clostridium sporogenes]APH15489.1 hypothetical protein NPD5_3980 [Clostridium sporogenes]